MITRRTLLKLAPLAVLCPFTKPSMSKPNSANWNRTLILIELNGGNDGLNTLVPYTDTQYYKLRPRLAIPKDQVLPLTDTIGLNPALESLMPSWHSNDLDIVQGVGYPEPNRSHFRSIEIWDTASNSTEYLQEGWLAQLFAQNPLSKNYIAEGIILDNNMGPLTGEHSRSIVLKNPKKLFKLAKRSQKLSTTLNNAPLQHILKVQNDIYSAAKTIAARLENSPSNTTQFPSTKFGRQLGMAARLLKSKLPVPVIKLSHGSFDTHSRQRGQHDRLLQQWADGLSVFRNTLKQSNLWDQVLIVTYSEFGRRPAQNNSQGTDHGTAAPHFLIGGNVKGGLYGKQSSLTDLQNGDLKHHVDFRSVYTTIAQKWWQISNIKFSNTNFSPIDCITNKL